MVVHLDCGYEGNLWVRHALQCVPRKTQEGWFDKLAFVCTTESDGKRLTRSFVRERSIIVLSERIVPRGPVAEDHADVRYFVFAVLHEVVHAIHDDLPPNEISTEANHQQEYRADELAMKWLNDHLRSRRVDQLPFTRDELKRAQDKNQALMTFASNG